MHQMQVNKGGSFHLRSSYYWLWPFNIDALMIDWSCMCKIHAG